MFSMALTLSPCSVAAHALEKLRAKEERELAPFSP